MNDNEIKTEQERLDYRSEVANSIWGDGPVLKSNEGLYHDEEAEVKEELEEEHVEEKADQDDQDEKEDDPLAGLDPAVKAYVDEQLGTINNLKYRLQQAESRVGSLQNAIQNPKQQSKKEDSPPEKTPEEQEIDELWEGLKEEWPEDREKFDAMEKKFAGRSAVNTSQIVSEIRQELETDFSKKLTDAQIAMETKIVSLKHPNFRDLISEPEYSKWLSTQDPELQSKAYESNDSLDVIEVLDRYVDSKGGSKKSSIQEKREKRLSRSAETPRSGKTVKPKSVDQMTDEEFRQYEIEKRRKKSVH